MYKTLTQVQEDGSGISAAELGRSSILGARPVAK